MFSFGFGPRLFGFKRGHTDYRVSLIPAGGYCMFLGEGVVNPGQKLEPDDYNAKKRWQRFLVIAAAPLANILLAIVLMAAVNMVGVDAPAYLDQPPVIGWIEPGSPAEKAGLLPDDVIRSLNRKPVSTWTDVEMAVTSQPDTKLKVGVERGGLPLSLELLTENLRAEKKSKFDLGYAGFFGKILTQVRMVNKNSPAEQGGLKPGDVVREIDGRPVYFYQFIEILEKSAGKPLAVTVDRGGTPVTLTVTPRLESGVGMIGVMPGAQSVRKQYGFFMAITQSLKENAKLVTLVVDVIRKLFTGETSTRQLAGPIEIANFSYAALKLGLAALISWIALFSLQLGVINLLPIPVLDGGQLFILSIEGLIRRDLGPKLRQIWLNIGFVIFIFLVGFTILNDIVRRLPRGWRSLVPF
ncbi:MAG: RIP metalloprotease RseP [Candidatus Aminicenantes bacterium RBG_13_63_10]|nr:MAG: RIP metalloprotease RseP [Candidatus Aminicenantes bacterium RBG_13_63_10]